jgi:hypothetical protein
MRPGSAVVPEVADGERPPGDICPTALEGVRALCPEAEG